MFYFLSSCLIVAIFTYFLFTIKVNIQTQEINEIDKKMLNYSIYQQKENEKTIVSYQKIINDFSSIIKNRKISSRLFDFIEKNTLPNIWFSNFDMSYSTNDIKLSGEAENMETLINQINFFEENKDYIKSINILNSQINSNGKIKFTLNLSLNYQIFATGLNQK